jgi:hypothetical protein
MLIFAWLNRIFRGYNQDARTSQPVAISASRGDENRFASLTAAAQTATPNEESAVMLEESWVDSNVEKQLVDPPNLTFGEQFAQAWKARQEEALGRLEEELATAEQKRRKEIGQINRMYYGGSCPVRSNALQAMMHSCYESDIRRIEGTFAEASTKSHQTYDDAIMRLQAVRDSFPVAEEAEAALAEALAAMSRIFWTPKHIVYPEFALDYPDVLM